MDQIHDLARGIFEKQGAPGLVSSNEDEPGETLHLFLLQAIEKRIAP